VVFVAVGGGDSPPATAAIAKNDVKSVAAISPASFRFREAMAVRFRSSGDAGQAARTMSGPTRTRRRWAMA
jgi:hypothetical protein